MWPFPPKKAVDLHPLLQRFREIMRSPRCLEWFERVDNGASSMLPVDVGFEVQEAINLSYSLTSMASVHSSDLIRAAKKDDFRGINDRLQRAEHAVRGQSADNLRPLSRIVEWANDHKLPSLSSFDATFYKEAGVPRDINRLGRLRHLLVTEDHGITEIPDELVHLPLLVGVCLTNNKIQSIPKALYGCKTLQRLDLEDNAITRVDDGIHMLKHVYAVDLSGNKLQYLTADIARMPSLKKLDISNQRTEIDFMRAIDTPLPPENLEAIYRLVETIDVKY